MKCRKRISIVEADEFVPQAGAWPLGVRPFTHKDAKTALVICANCKHRMVQHGVVRIPTKGNVFLCPGDWVVTDGLGHQTVVKMQDFEDEYELVGKDDDE